MSTFLPSQWTTTTNQDANQLLVGVPQQSYLVENAYKSWSFSNPGGDNTSLRFEVRPGDHWSSAAWTDPSTSERSEVSASTRYAVGTNIHISYDFMVEPGAANHANWLVIGQLHHTGSSWSPPFEIDLKGERMAVTIDTAGANANAWSQYHTVWTDPQNIVRGHTYHMDINVRFDTTNGHIDVSRDGVQVVNYNGPLGWSDMGSATYWKEGIYRSASDTTIAADYSHLSITTGSTPTSSGSSTSSGSTTPTPTTTAGLSIGGTNGADNLVGTAGNDTIAAARGVDTITGGAGGDLLYGGRGADRFVFGAGFGHDTIADFNGGAGDQLRFQGVGAVTHVDTANGIVFSDAAGDSVLLRNVHTIASSGWIVS